MNRRTIFKKLKNYLPAEMLYTLQISTAIAPGISICCHVDDIIKNYNCDQDTEKIVSHLLEKLLQIHFNKKRS